MSRLDRQSFLGPQSDAILDAATIGIVGLGGGGSHIRAYSGIEEDVMSIILAAVKPPMDGTKVTEELTVQLLARLATEAGYTTDKLRQMARCLSPASKPRSSTSKLTSTRPCKTF